MHQFGDQTKVSIFRNIHFLEHKVLMGRNTLFMALYGIHILKLFPHVGKIFVCKVHEIFFVFFSNSYTLH